MELNGNRELKKNQRHHWFPYEMTSEKQVQKFHTDDTSLPESASVSDWLKQEELEENHGWMTASSIKLLYYTFYVLNTALETILIITKE